MTVERQKMCKSRLLGLGVFCRFFICRQFYHVLGKCCTICRSMYLEITEKPAITNNIFCRILMLRICILRSAQLHGLSGVVYFFI